MISREFDPYAVMGVPPTATSAEIKERYRLQLSMKHPDRFQKLEQKRIAEEDTKALVAAYQILSDPSRRRAWDEAHARATRPPEQPPHPFFQPAFLDFGPLAPSVQKTLKLRLHNDGGPATSAQLDVSVEGSWFSIDIADPGPEDPNCLKVLSVTARGPGGQGTLNEWVSITLDGVTARADLRMTTIPPAQPARQPPPSRPATSRPAPPPSSPPPPRSASPTSSSANGVGPIVVVLVIIGIVGLIALVSIAVNSQGKSNLQQQQAAAPAVDPWIVWRDNLVAEVNQAGRDPYSYALRNEVQTILRDLARQQMNSRYVTPANAAFMREFLARIGPCHAPTDVWECRWYPVAMQAEVLNASDLLVSGVMRSPYPGFHELDNTGFTLLFHREGDHWLVLPPPGSNVEITTSEAVDTAANTSFATDTMTTGTMSTKSSCPDYLRGREDLVACNENAAFGYYWRVERKREHYSVAGVTPNGSQPTCDATTLGSTAMTARFPLEHPTFLPVYEQYANAATEPTAPQCNYVGLGIKKTDADLSATCGIFEVTCSEQP
jgi:hypothetical protein